MKPIKKTTFTKARRVGGEMVSCSSDPALKMSINLSLAKGLNHCFSLSIVHVSFLLISVLSFYS